MAFSLKGLLEGMGQQKEQSVVGIDVGSSFLKVVQLKKSRGRVVLETYGELALGPYAGGTIGQATALQATQIGKALTDLFREARVTATRGGVAIPLTSSILSLMQLPNLPEQQLANMIPIEARKYIPVPIGEVSLDWWILPKDKIEDAPEDNRQPKTPTVSVMMVAIHKETTGKYQSLLNGLRLNPAFMELEAFATARSTFGSSTAPVMIVDMGAASTKLSVIEYGIIRNQHTINRGSQEITLALSRSLNISLEQAEDIKRASGLVADESNTKAVESIRLTTSSILHDINRGLIAYEREAKHPVSRIVLSGGGMLLKGMKDFATEQFSTEVTLADPFSKTEAPAFLGPVLAEAGPEFAVAIGLALRALQDVR